MKIQLGCFDTAALSASDEMCHVVRGSIPHVAPEALLHDVEGFDGMGADMWSVGVVFLQLCCGVRPVHAALRGRGDAALVESLSTPGRKVTLDIARQFQAAFDDGKITDDLLRLSSKVDEAVMRRLSPFVCGLVDVCTTSRLTTQALLSMMP